MTPSPVTRKLRIKSASAYSVIATVANAVFLFLVFRESVHRDGPSVIGCWALIQGLLLVSRIADSGAGANLTRYLASRTASMKQTRTTTLLGAALAISTGPVAILVVVSAVPIQWFVTRQFGSELSGSQIVRLTVFASTCAVLSSIATVALSIIEGQFRLVWRSQIVLVSNLAGIVLAAPLISHLGSDGVGISYVLVFAVQVVLGLGSVVVNRTSARAGSSSVDLAGAPTVRETVAALWAENVRLSGVALIQLAFEPLVKFFLSFTASLDQIASFELALRLTTQIRVLFQAALQPLLALGARTGAANETQQRQFKFAYWLVAGGASVAYLLLVVNAPALSVLGLSEVTGSFLLFTSILAAGNIVNCLGLTGYFHQLSGGQLTWLLWLQAYMGLLVGLGGTIGLAYGGPPVIVGSYSIALAVGGAALATVGGTVGRRAILVAIVCAGTITAASALVSTFGRRTLSSIGVAFTVDALVVSCVMLGLSAWWVRKRRAVTGLDVARE